jgi:raffinose/stachyose/melibiose transport system substrate-binding protein
VFRRQGPSVRLIAAITGIALGGTLALSGCGSSSTTAGDGGSATAGNVVWWSWTPDNDLAAREIAAFNQQYPNIKVTYKKVPNADYSGVLRPALASSVGPDVFTVAAAGATGPVSVFAPHAQDLAPAISKLLGSDWKSKIYPTAVTDFTVNGKLAGSPWAKQGAGNVWINKDLFDKYGLSVPTTLAEWVKVCATFRSKGLGCFKEGIGGSGFDVDTLHSIADSVQPGLWAAAASGQKKWTDPGLVTAWTIFKKMSDEGILDAGGVGVQQYPDVNNAFLTGKVPMIQMGFWYSQYATDNSLTAALAGAGVPASTPKITILPASFPDVAGKGNPSTIFADPDAAQAVNSKSKVLNAATTFALWLGGTKQGQQVVTDNVDEIASLNGVQANWASIKVVNPTVQIPALKNLASKVSAATEIRDANLPAVKFQAIIDADQGVLGGQESPAAAAAAVQQVFDANPTVK